jgi:hypothetical protein
LKCSIVSDLSLSILKLRKKEEWREGEETKERNP